MKPTLLFYCQHSPDVDHVFRSWALADALSSIFDVVLVSPGERPAGMKPPSNIEVVMLPAHVHTTAVTSMTRRDGRLFPGARSTRARLLLDTFFLREPAVVLVERFPFGHATFTHEILPMLEYAAAARRRPLVVCSLPDPLEGAGRNQRHEDRARQIADDYFDAVLVHTDPRLTTLADTFKPRSALRLPVIYTGLVPSRPSLARHTAKRTGIIVSAEDGRAGGPLFRAAIEAHALCPTADRQPMRIVTGPLLPDHEDAALRSQAMGYPDVTIERCVPALRPLLTSAALSISQCGHHAALDVLQARVPALVVPRADGREDDERARASKLEALGALRVLDLDVLTGPRLAIEILAARTFAPSPLTLNLDGADETARVVTRLWIAGDPAAPLYGVGFVKH